MQSSESLKPHDQSKRKLSRLNSPAQTRKTKPPHVQAALKQAQAQTLKQPSNQVSFTEIRPRVSPSVLSNSCLASAFKKSLTSQSTSKCSLPFQDTLKKSTSTKKQFLANNTALKQPQSKSTSEKQNLIHKSAPKLTLGDKSKSKQSSLTETGIKRKEIDKPKPKQSKVTKSTPKQRSSSPNTGKRSSVANATQKSTIKTTKRKTPTAKPVLRQTSASQGATRGHHVPKSKRANSKVPESNTRRVASKRSPPNNLMGSRSTTRITKSTDIKSQRCNYDGSQNLPSKNKGRKTRPLYSINLSSGYPALPLTREHRVRKPHPPPSRPIKSHSSRLRPQTSKPHKPCPRQPKRQPSEISIEATATSHTAPATAFANTAKTATRGADVTSSSAQATPTAKALATTLPPTATNPTSQVTTLSAAPPRPGQQTTTPEGDVMVAVTGTTAAAIDETISVIETATVKTGTTIQETVVTATGPTVTIVSAKSEPHTVTNPATATEALKSTPAAPAADTATLGTTPPVTILTSALPNAITTTRTTLPEKDVTTPEEYFYYIEDEIEASDYAYGSESAQDSAAIPETNATGPVTPSTPGATPS